MKLSTTFDKLSLLLLGVVLAVLSGCASVPMASKEQDSASKSFANPASDKVGLYIYRDSFLGKAVKRNISVDGKLIGATANKTYFYQAIAPGEHTLTTESEFGDNVLTFTGTAGKNYYARQYMKVGVFSGGTGVEMVSDEEGRKAVLECEQAQSQ